MKQLLQLEDNQLTETDEQKRQAIWTDTSHKKIHTDQKAHENTQHLQLPGKCKHKKTCLELNLKAY